MNDRTPLFRQIASDWIVDGRPTSQAFRPFKSDRLSMYGGDMIFAEDSHVHCTQQGNKSAGVAVVLVGEVKENGLAIVEDRVPYKEHVSVDYDGISKSKLKLISRELAEISSSHGWAFKPK